MAEKVLRWFWSLHRISRLADSEQVGPPGVPIRMRPNGDRLESEAKPGTWSRQSGLRWRSWQQMRQGSRGWSLDRDFQKKRPAACERHSHKPSPATVFDYSRALAQGDWCPGPALARGHV